MSSSKRTAGEIDRVTVEFRFLGRVAPVITVRYKDGMAVTAEMTYGKKALDRILKPEDAINCIPEVVNRILENVEKKAK